MAIAYGNSQGLEVRLEGPFGSVGSSVKLTAVTLSAASWKNGESPYFQTVEVPGISEAAAVDLRPDKEQLARLCREGTALHIENDGGVTTAYAIGTKPDYDLTLQVTLTEVVST